MRRGWFLGFRCEIVEPEITRSMDRSQSIPRINFNSQAQLGGADNGLNLSGGSLGHAELGLGTNDIISIPINVGASGGGFGMEN